MLITEPEKYASLFRTQKNRNTCKLSKAGNHGKRLLTGEAAKGQSGKPVGGSSPLGLTFPTTSSYKLRDLIFAIPFFSKLHLARFCSRGSIKPQKQCLGEQMMFTDNQDWSKADALLNNVCRSTFSETKCMIWSI